MKVLLAAAFAFVLGIVAAFAVQGALQAGEASKNKRALTEARNISEALEKYRAATGEYPPLESGLAEAARYLQPQFIRHVQTNDAYARPYIVFIDRFGAAVVSTGRNGFVVRKSGVVPPADNSVDHP
jgi:type II secretory pathway pseudopilin PulG